MNRGIVIGSVLAVAALAATISFRACAAAPATQPAAQPAAAAAQSPAMSQWQPGVHYTVLRYPGTPAVAKGKVLVNEVFWYGCSHCYALDPTLEDWKKRKPEFIEFVRIPVIWGPAHRQHARLFYTLQKLGREDLHPKVFNTIHELHNPLMAATDEQARAMHLAFFKENGVTEKQFNDAYDSPEVAQQVVQAERLTGDYEIAAVPTMVVAGAYSTGVSQAGGEKQLLSLINDLAIREQRR
jgi:thiol:disulfide interchange protein DsbA